MQDFLSRLSLRMFASPPAIRPRMSPLFDSAQIAINAEPAEKLVRAPEGTVAKTDPGSAAHPSNPVTVATPSDPAAIAHVSNPNATARTSDKTATQGEKPQSGNHRSSRDSKKAEGRARDPFKRAATPVPALVSTPATQPSLHTESFVRAAPTANWPENSLRDPDPQDAKGESAQREIVARSERRKSVDETPKTEVSMLLPQTGVGLGEAGKMGSLAKALPAIRPHRDLQKSNFSRARVAADQNDIGEAPTIRVTIGKVEVRAAAPPPVPQRRRKPSAMISLDDYLKGRGRG